MKNPWKVMKMDNISRNIMIQIAIVIFLGFVVNSQPFVRDVAQGKPINANMTCGFQEPENYFEHDQQFRNDKDRAENEMTCVNMTQFPPTNANDGDLATIWQSASRNLFTLQGFGVDRFTADAIIYIDLQRVYTVDRITLRMGDAKRPGRTSIRKSTTGVYYTPWVHLVTTESTGCLTYSQTQGISTPDRLDSVVCRTYGNSRANNFETYSYDFTPVTGNLKTWRDTQYIQIDFFDIDLTLGLKGNKFVEFVHMGEGGMSAAVAMVTIKPWYMNLRQSHHYSVAAIEIQAQCECNNQEASCDVDPETNMYECVCGGFTQGRYCEQCQLMYNQNAYVRGQQCEECNCFNHADSCYFDPIVANNSMSLNMALERRGGGVCNNCRDNTTGVNCHECVDFYYRPEGRLPSDALPCQQCQCNMAGVRVNEETQLRGDCVKNVVQAMLPEGLKPGDCFCKPNVISSQCSVCKEGYFNLTAENPNGCQECLCDPAGSQGAICDPATAGLCTCKANVQGRQCNACKEAFFNLNINNTLGCSPCECDSGGAFNNVCNLGDGQCPCRSNIRDRQCTRSMSGYFYPDPHFISGEFEDLQSSWSRELPGFNYFGYATITPGVAAVAYLAIPRQSQFSNLYNIQLRFAQPLAQQVTANLQITQSGFPVPLMMENILIPNCLPVGSWCYYTGSDVSLIKGQSYQVMVTSEATIYLDRAMALPSDYKNSPEVALGPERAEQFNVRCSLVDDNLGVQTDDDLAFCRSAVFSLSTFYLEGALSCECHVLGAYQNVTCEEYGGQCLCKEGVFSRRCDECQLEYFGLHMEGCRPCACATDNKVCDRVTGQCACPAHTIGRQCDRCELHYFNWTSAAGCQPCNCDPTGAADLQCNATSGVCECKQGVTGDKCDTCMAGYKGFGPTGCLSCQCNVGGSTGDICDATTGQCPCKNNTQGLLCELCQPGTFYNAEGHRDGCLDCVCMGVTAECQSTVWHLKTVNLRLESAEDASVSVLQLATDGAVLDTVVNIQTVNGGTKRMASTPVGSNAKVYWQHPDLHGNLLGLYGSNISFTAYYTTTDPSAVVMTPSLLLYGQGAVIYEFPVEPVAVGIVTQRDVTITVENIQTTAPVSRGDLLMALSDVRKVLIPASYFSFSHTTFVSDISYKMADSLGTGQRALTVEDCNCPVGYTGTSCELCAPGYRRENVTTQGYLGFCVPCECNSHTPVCDPDTGECLDCLHNTEGFNCESCMTGYYGDALAGTPFDCQQCPCYTPRVVNSTCDEVIEGVVQCLYCETGYMGNICDQCEADYFGNPSVQDTGTCKQCTCNGNSDTCDPITGVCLDCGFNTTGTECEVCADGFYGNASAQLCTPCGCDPLGSVTNVCEAESGNCTCLPGVGQRTCDSCLENHYGFNNMTILGCQPCECNEFGSQSLQCDDTGVCTCLPAEVAPGRDKCDRCVDNFWGLPNRGCQECACDVSGSIDASLPCASVSGQCDCKAGIAGRQCNECAYLFIGTPQTGCTKCGRCEDSLGNDTLALETLGRSYYNDTLMVVDVQNLDPALLNLSSQINNTLSSLGLSQDRLSTLTESVNNLTSNEPRFVGIVEDLTNRVSSTLLSAERLYANSSSDVERIQALLLTAEEAQNISLGLQETAPRIITRMAFYNNSAFELLQLANSIQLNLNTTFDAELKAIAEEKAAAQTALTDAIEMRGRVEQQSNLTSTLERSTQSAQTSLLTLNTDMNAISQRLLVLAYDISTVYVDLNVTQYNKQRAETLLAEIQSLLDASEATLFASAKDFGDAERLLGDAVLIHNGNGGGALPVDTTVDLTGISGWLSASDALSSRIAVTTLSLGQYQTAVSNTENIADDLTRLAQGIQEAFVGVQSQGQAAVNAIDDYELVVAQLDESLQMALTANETMGATQRILATVSVEGLTAQAEGSLAESRKMLDSATAWNNTPAVVEPTIQAANESLQQAIVEWSVVNGSLTDLQNSADALNDKVLADPLTSTIVEADSLAARTRDTAESVDSLDRGIAPLVQSHSDNVAVIQAKVNNASLLHVQIETDLNNFQSTLNTDVKANIAAAETDYSITNRTLTSLEAKLAAIEEKLQRARQRLAGLEQPINIPYTTHEALENPDSGKDLIFSEVSLEFKYTYVAQGLLFFTMNPDTEEKLLIQIVGGSVMLEVRNVDSVMNTTSPAILCAGCWFRVVASRYGIDAQLTVTKMTTGGVAVTSTREESSQNELLKTTSSIYMGGLPEGFPQDNVYPNPEFEGCMYNVRYNGDPLPIWQRALHVTSEAECCAQPPSLPTPPTQDAVDFKGFGYLKLNYGDFSVQSMAQATFSFRTFDTSAVLLLLDTDTTNSYYGIFLRDGRVLFEIMSDNGIKTSVETTNRYNDGVWYKLSALHDASSAQISIQRADPEPGDIADVQSQSTAISVPSLIGGEMTIGGQNPNTTFNHGPVSSSYAGAMLDVQLSRGDSQVPLPQTLAAFAAENSMVNLYTTYQQVVSGLALEDPTGYGCLRAIPSTVDTIQFELLTYQETGIVMYAQLRANPPQTYVYLGLLNGNLLLLFDQGLGTRLAVRTRKLYLSTGQAHSVRLDFSFQNSPRLTVNGVTHYGAVTMSPHMGVEGNVVYVGGVPPTVALQMDELPTSQALIGGVRGIRINGDPVDIFNQITLSGFYQKGVSLSGLPAPPSALPPLPYVTTPAPPTTPAPACAPHMELALDVVGVRFGDFQSSFMGYDVSASRKILSSAFSIRVEFRAVQGDGLLLYFASAPVSLPKTYFAVYLDDGHLFVSMRSNSTRVTDNPRDTLQLKSKSRYNDGTWWEMEVLRLNDFIALIVFDNKDYMNNNVSSKANSTLDVGSNFFLGGVPPSLSVGEPFEANAGIPIGSKPFRGCLRRVEVMTHQYDSLKFDLTSPQESEGLSQCYADVSAGVHMEGTNSYVRVQSTTQSTFNFAPDFSVNVTFTTTRRNGTLMTIWETTTRHFLLGLHNGEVRAVVGNRLDANAPFLAVSTALSNDYTVCNNAPHSVVVTVSSVGMTIQVDDAPGESYAFPQSFQIMPPFMTFRPVYVGLRDPTWNVPSVLSGEALRGCIVSVAINGVTFELLESPDKRAVLAGCPAPPGSDTEP